MGHAHDVDSRRKAATKARGDSSGGEAPSPLELQRTAGNKAVTELLAGAQPKLAVGSVDAPEEREADAVAGEVVRTIRQGTAGSSGAPLAGRRDGALPADTRAAVEGAFGTDFSDVRIHTGPEATGMNDEIGARAFTVGKDIYFRDGLPAAGDPLLAHELQHVVQQRTGPADTIRRKETPKGKGTGPKTETTTETKVEHDELGKTTTKETKNKTGSGESSEETSESFDGTTTKSVEKKDETLVGIETAIKKIERLTELERQQAIEASARAGVFGEKARKAAIERGAMSAKAEGSVSGKAGAEGTAKGSVTVSKDLMHALEVVFEAQAMVGAGVEMKGGLEAKLGPLIASINAELSVFVGAKAQAKGKLSAGLTHIDAEGEASAMAGAEAEGKAEAKVKLGNAEASAAIEGKALAGAEASVGGKFKIDLSGVEIAGKAEAFAGVKAEGKAGASVGYKGKPIFSASGKLEVSAGVGGSAGGEFSFRNGKLVIKGELAAALGIGAGVGVEIEVDFYQLALFIEEQIVDFFFAKKEAIERNSPGTPRTPIIDDALAAQTRQKGYDTYIKDFMAYDAKKGKQGNSGVKRERVQEILDKRWHANKDNWQFLEFDEGIERAAREAFGSKLKYIIVQAGQLRAFEIKRTAEQEAHLKKERMKKGLKF